MIERVIAGKEQDKAVTNIEANPEPVEKVDGSKKSSRSDKILWIVSSSEDDDAGITSYVKIQPKLGRLEEDYILIGSEHDEIALQIRDILSPKVTRKAVTKSRFQGFDLDCEIQMSSSRTGNSADVIEIMDDVDTPRLEFEELMPFPKCAKSKMNRHIQTRFFDDDDVVVLSENKIAAGAFVVFEAPGGAPTINMDDILIGSSLKLTCGCCYDDGISESDVTVCMDGHVFCKECAKSNARVAIGLCRTEIKCMRSEEICNYLFHDSELKKFLPIGEYEAYLLLCQEKCISSAEIEGLHTCPFCPYAIIIDLNAQVINDSLFHCLRDKCKKISCRICRKENHLPDLCDDIIDSAHLVAEAMTSALMRNCPKCKVAFFKTEGCNKMTCSSCHTIMCYVCRTPINGYEHFAGQGQQLAICPLWDNTGQRNQDEAIAAGKAELQKLGVDQTAIAQLVSEASFPAVPPGPGHLNAQVAIPRIVAMPPLQIQPRLLRFPAPALLFDVDARLAVARAKIVAQKPNLPPYPTGLIQPKALGVRPTPIARPPRRAPAPILGPKILAHGCKEKAGLQRRNTRQMIVLGNVRPIPLPPVSAASSLQIPSIDGVKTQPNRLMLPPLTHHQVPSVPAQNRKKQKLSQS